jgi:hypothetical protein
VRESLERVSRAQGSPVQESLARGSPVQGSLARESLARVSPVRVCRARVRWLCLAQVSRAQESLARESLAQGSPAQESPVQVSRAQVSLARVSPAQVRDAARLISHRARQRRRALARDNSFSGWCRHACACRGAVLVHVQLPRTSRQLPASRAPQDAPPCTPNRPAPTTVSPTAACSKPSLGLGSCCQACSRRSCRCTATVLPLTPASRHVGQLQLHRPSC